MNDPVSPVTEPSLVGRAWDRITARLIEDFLRQVRQLAGQGPGRHAKTHKASGGDVVHLDELGAASDNTALNATTAHHGLLPKLGGGTANFLRADGTWAAAGGSGSSEEAMVYSLFLSD
jgi:hypothetical protein